MKTKAKKKPSLANSSRRQEDPEKTPALTAHPEDLIFETKTLINQLAAVQEERFARLCSTLSMNEKGTDWLFDYVHNCDEPICFDEYLAKYGIEYPQCCSVAPSA